MTKQTNTLAFGFCTLLIVVGSTQAPKIYSVAHTEAEWAQILAGQREVQTQIHNSTLPANAAFWCDSVLQAQQNDIYKQVIPQKQAEDTTKSKKH